MSPADFPALVSRHRKYFRSAATRSTEWRERQLKALRAMMTERAEDFYAALWADLRRNHLAAAICSTARQSCQEQQIPAA